MLVHRRQRDTRGRQPAGVVAVAQQLAVQRVVVAVEQVLDADRDRVLARQLIAADQVDGGIAADLAPAKAVLAVEPVIAAGVVAQLHAVAPLAHGPELQVRRNLERRNAVTGHVLHAGAALRPLAPVDPGDGAARAPALVVRAVVCGCFHARDALFGAGQDQAVVEALHVAKLGRGVEQRHARQRIAQRAAPAQFIVVGLDRIEAGRIDIEAGTRVADLQADVRQLEALAERGIELLALDRRIGRAQVEQPGTIVDRAALDRGRVAHARLRQRHEIIEAGAGALIAQAALGRPLLAELVLQLAKNAATARGQRRHVGGRADAVEDQPAAAVVGARIEQVQRHVAALLVVVGAPQQLGGLGLAQWRADGQASAEDVAVLADLVDIAAARGYGARIEGRETREIVAVVELARYRAAEQVLVLVVQVDHGIAQLVLVVQLQAADRARGGGTGRRPGHRRIGRIVGVLLRLVTADAQLQPLLPVDAPAQLAAQVVDVGIEEIALARLRRNAVAFGIVGAADALRAQVEGIVDRSLAAGEMLLHVGAQPFLGQPRQRRAQRHRGIRARRSAGLARGDRDDAAAGARPVQRAAAAQHLDALDIAGVDGGQVARRVPVGVQRDAVDQHQRAAPAQRLAEIRHRAAGIGHARNDLAQHGGKVGRPRAQLVQLLALDHRDLPHRVDQVALDTVDPHLHGIQAARFHRRGLGLGHLGLGGADKRHRARYGTDQQGQRARTKGETERGGRKVLHGGCRRARRDLMICNKTGNDNDSRLC
ncbi:hypothetical protein CBM2633_B90018 [Cupriavidus taiwanensis]|nr:hypothetical protein CBM2633_B90018 [Cupriavidus taiwanensis]